MMYTNVKGYQIPNLSLPKAKKTNLNRYGRMRLDYLEQNEPNLCDQMMLEGTLLSSCRKMGLDAQQMVDKTLRDLMQKAQIYKNVWQDHRQDILEEYQQEQENGAANSEKVEEALSWQESFPNDEVSREFLDRFVPRIFSINGQKFIWELNLFQESCTVQCNVRGTYNYHSISAEKIMPGKTKAKKVDGAVNRILEDTNSTRFWVHTYDDDPISRLLLKIREHKAFIASYR